MKYGEFDTRMKKYEFVTRTYLYTRTPAIIRIDGKSFHTFTHGFKKPFDDILFKSMQETMKFLCENIQGCVLGYNQSDEITLVLVDYKTLDTSPWFEYNIQKCSSIAASMATMAFNKAFSRNVSEFISSVKESESFYTSKYISVLERAVEKGAMFDARIFNIPKEEVCNNLLWRQNDAARNSVQMVGRAFFSDKQLYKKSCNEIQEMLFSEKGVNWDNYPTCYKRGSCCVRKVIEDSGKSKWFIDNEIPVFKGDGREYVNELVYVGE